MVGLAGDRDTSWNTLVEFLAERATQTLLASRIEIFGQVARYALPLSEERTRRRAHTFLLLLRVDLIILARASVVLVGNQHSSRAGYTFLESNIVIVCIRSAADADPIDLDWFVFGALTFSDYLVVDFIGADRAF